MYWNYFLYLSKSEPVVTSPFSFWLSRFGTIQSPLELGGSGFRPALVGTESSDTGNATNCNDESASRNVLIIIISC